MAVHDPLMVPERQTQAQAETAEGLRQARARDTLSRLARAPSGLDTHASVHQAGRQLEEVPQARVGPDPGEETDHVQTQPSEDLTPTPGLPSPHVWLWTPPFVGLHPGLWLLLLPATNSSSQREDPESLSSRGVTQVRKSNTCLPVEAQGGPWISLS